MLDNVVLETQSDTGSVTLFVPENEYGTIEVPEAVRREVISPRGALLGVTDDVLENTLFTRVKLGISDFVRFTRRNISLLFIKKDVVNKMPSAITGFSPAFIILESRYVWEKGFFIGQTEESAAKTKTLLKDHFLLLPLYLTLSGYVETQGVNVALRNFYDGGAGKLWAKAFIFRDIYICGESYFSLPDCKYRYTQDMDFYSVWRNWSLFHEVSKRLREGTVDYDIDQIATPDHMKYGEDGSKC